MKQTLRVSWGPATTGATPPLSESRSLLLPTQENGNVLVCKLMAFPQVVHRGVERIAICDVVDHADALYLTEDLTEPGC